jgi:hypothetical protein
MPVLKRTKAEQYAGDGPPSALTDAADHVLLSTCYRLFSKSDIEENQRLAPDVFSLRAPAREGCRSISPP